MTPSKPGGWPGAPVECKTLAEQKQLFPSRSMPASVRKTPACFEAGDLVKGGIGKTDTTRATHTVGKPSPQKITLSERAPHVPVSLEVSGLVRAGGGGRGAHGPLRRLGAGAVR